MNTVFDSSVPERRVEEKPVPTLTDIKKWNKEFITRELPTAAICGHKLDPEVGPSSNCVNCWLVFFNSDGERVQLLTELLNDGKENEITEFYGKKYTKNFKRFLVALSEIKKRENEK